MFYRCLMVLVAGLVVSTAACGKSEEQQRAERLADEASKAAENVAGGAEQVAKGLEGLAKGFQELAQSADVKPVDPVSFRDLQTAFGNLSGWEKDKPTGERMTAPVAFSEASVTYRQGDASIDAKIIDSGFNQILMAPFAMFLSAGYEKETQDGYEKSVKVGEHPGWEKWNAEGKDGELNAVISKRFLLTLEGNGIESTKVLYDLAQATDLAKLAGMK
jgi:hypothetical protein